MKLHDPKFEARLKRTIKQRLKASPELRKQAKQQGGSKATPAPENLLWHVIGIFLLGALVYAQKGQGLTLGSQLAVVSIVCLGLAFFQVPMIYGVLYGSADLAVFAHLPIADQMVFRWQWQKILRRSAWLGAYGLVGYLAIALSWDTGWPGVGTAVVAALAQWLVSLSFATGLAAWRPGWPHHMIGLLFLGPFFLFFFIKKYIPATLLIWADESAWIVNYLMPTGWVSQLFSQVVTGFKLELWLLTPLLAGVLYFGRSGRELIISFYQFEDTSDQSVELEEEELATLDRTEADNPELAALRMPPAPLTRTGITDHLDNLQSREFLKGEPLFAGGWIERLFQRWLTARETLLLEAFLGGLPGWTQQWKVAVLIATAGLAGCTWLAYSEAETGQAICVVIGLLAFFVMLPLGLDFQRFFSGYQIGTSQVPFMAGFPISYRDIRGLLFKAAAVRALAALPVLVIGTALMIEFVFREPGTKGLLWGMAAGFKLALAMLLIQPAICASHFSRTMTLRKGHIIAKTFMVFALAVLATLLLVALIAGVVVPNLWVSVIGLAVAGISAWLIEALYARNYNRNKSDLLMYQPTE